MYQNGFSQNKRMMYTRGCAMDNKEEQVLQDIAELEAILANWKDDGTPERRKIYSLLCLCLESAKEELRCLLH